MVLNLSYLNNILRFCHKFETVINVTAGCATSHFPADHCPLNLLNRTVLRDVTLPLRINTFTLGRISGNSGNLRQNVIY